jgi:hypothetical protein
VVRGLAVYKQTWNYNERDPQGRLRPAARDHGPAGSSHPEELKKTPYETMVDMSFVKKARKLA